MAPPQDPRRWSTGLSKQTKENYASALKKTTQDIDAVSSWSAFPAGYAAVQGWETKYDKSTIPSYTNIKLYTKVGGVAKMWDQVSKSDSDIEPLILSL